MGRTVIERPEFRGNEMRMGRSNLPRSKGHNDKGQSDPTRQESSHEVGRGTGHATTPQRKNSPPARITPPSARTATAPACQ